MNDDLTVWDIVWAAAAVAFGTVYMAGEAFSIHPVLQIASVGMFMYCLHRCLT